jgi:hypothetical protein
MPLSRVLPQVLFDVRQLSDPTDQGFGLMGVQLVIDNMEAVSPRAESPPQLADGSTDASRDVAGHQIPAHDEGTRPMLHILKFPPLDLARASGKPGCLRSSACTLVNSSVLAVTSPCSARSVTSSYTIQMALTCSSRSESWGGVSQYRIRCGWRSLFQQASCVPRRDLLDVPSCHPFVGDFSSRPLADGTLFGLGASHRHQLADLLGGNLAPPSRVRDITESVLHREICKRDGLQRKPAFAPGRHRLHV